jgi:cytochrome c biogenesis factor
MTNLEERLFMLDLAIVQLIAGILVTLGSTLFAISIGFGLTIPTAMQDAILQLLVMKTEVTPEVQQMLVQESLSNYVLVLAAVGVLLIVIGVSFASARTNKIRKQIRINCNISDLLATDIRKKESITNEIHTVQNESLSNQSRSNKDDLTIEREERLDTKV